MKLSNTYHKTDGTNLTKIIKHTKIVYLQGELLLHNHTTDTIWRLQNVRPGARRRTLRH